MTVFQLVGITTVGGNGGVIDSTAVNDRQAVAKNK